MRYIRLGLNGTIPVRGRERILEEALDLVVVEYYPRKGARTGTPRQTGQTLRYYPRKGAKTYDDCTLSGTCTGTIPVRGRKLKVRFIIPVHSRTIPVRGRKPMPRPASSVPDCTIPVRGQKLRVLLCVNLFELYHPRKGTKNSASKKDAEFFFCKP